MPSSEMLRRVAPAITVVSDESIASIIGMKRIGELGTTLGVTRNRKFEELRFLGCYAAWLL
jgi:hypothetical protein